MPGAARARTPLPGQLTEGKPTGTPLRRPPKPPCGDLLRSTGLQAAGSCRRGSAQSATSSQPSIHSMQSPPLICLPHPSAPTCAKRSSASQLMPGPLAHYERCSFWPSEPNRNTIQPNADSPAKNGQPSTMAVILDVYGSYPPLLSASPPRAMTPKVTANRRDREPLSCVSISVQLRRTC